MKSRTTFSKKDLTVILASVLFVMMNIGAINNTGRRRAKEMVCLSNLRHWGMMFEMFTIDNDGYFNRGWDVGETDLWMNALRPYYKDNWALLMCPEASNVNGLGAFRAWQRDVDLTGGGMYHYTGSYGINSWTNNMTHDRGNRIEEWFWKNVRGVEGRNSIPVFADSVWHDAWPRYTDSPPPSQGGWPGGANEMTHFCIDRHNGAINMLFMDWSARKIGLKELWTLKWHRTFDTEGPWTRAGGVTPYDWPEWMRNFEDY